MCHCYNCGEKAARCPSKFKSSLTFDNTKREGVQINSVDRVSREYPSDDILLDIG